MDFNNDSKETINIMLICEYPKIAKHHVVKKRNKSQILF